MNWLIGGRILRREHPRGPQFVSISYNGVDLWAVAGRHECRGREDKEMGVGIHIQATLTSYRRKMEALSKRRRSGAHTLKASDTVRGY